MLSEPLHDVTAWQRYLDGVEIPVLQRTVQELALLRENEERVTSRDIARVLVHDPMFTLRVLRFLQAHRKAAQKVDITTVEHALMMLGITTFFTQFADLPVVESTLASQPLALAGLMRVAYRAHHAALYARDWADQRQDARADEVAIASLLHDMAEMLCWCFAPKVSLRISALQHSNEPLRSSVAQSSVLGFKFSELQVQLIALWRLAPLLNDLIDESKALNSRAINVALAVRLARHSARGWQDSALPDDYAAIQQFLKLTQAEALARIRRTAIKAETARGWYHLESVPIPLDLASPATGVQDGPGSTSI
jgi:HD-like signal output (HDOD) protein